VEEGILMAIERTYGMIKPDAVAAGNTGNILAMIEASGLRIVALRRTRFTPADAKAFYAVHAERGFYGELCAFMSSGPIVVMVLEGENAIARWRDLMGPTDSKKAGPDTVRGRYGTDIGQNAVHGSDAPETAALEIPFAFAARELI
jgi:nucleoside-diphosphate kinase